MVIHIHKHHGYISVINKMSSSDETARLLHVARKQTIAFCKFMGIRVVRYNRKYHDVSELTDEGGDIPAYSFIATSLSEVTGEVIALGIVTLSNEVELTGDDGLHYVVQTPGSLHITYLQISHVHTKHSLELMSYITVLLLAYVSTRSTSIDKLHTITTIGYTSKYRHGLKGQLKTFFDVGFVKPKQKDRHRLKRLFGNLENVRHKRHLRVFERHNPKSLMQLIDLIVDTADKIRSVTNNVPHNVVCRRPTSASYGMDHNSGGKLVGCKRGEIGAYRNAGMSNQYHLNWNQ